MFIFNDINYKHIIKKVKKSHIFIKTWEINTIVCEIKTS